MCIRDSRSTLWCVLQDCESLGDGLPTDEGEHAARLHRGNTNELGRRGCSGDGVSHCLSTSLLFLDVTLKGLGRCKLAELVANHGLVHEHRHVLTTVVDGESVTDEIGENGRTARPGLDDLLGACLLYTSPSPRDS